MTDRQSQIARAASARYRERHPERVRAYEAQYRADNRDVVIERTKRWRLANPETYRTGKLRQRLKRFGLTLEQFNALVEQQGGVCAICKNPEMWNRKDVKRLSVDHCHATGRVRGLLCNRCNRAIGLLGDNDRLCVAAAEYLRR